MPKTMPKKRLIYEVGTQSPYSLKNIATGETFSQDRSATIIDYLTDMPSYSVRRKASYNKWHIEIKTRTRGKNVGRQYWAYLRDHQFVNVNTPDVISDYEKSPIETVVERRTARNFSVKKQNIAGLLEKSHDETIPLDIDDDEAIINLIANANNLKPKFLKMEEDSWKLLVRSALRGKNVIMLGDKGEGKTMSAHALKNALGRPFFAFNFGNMQDAQTALIGKTHLDMKTGTWFNESEFVKAIQIPGAIILCDELSRISDDASNILFSVFDENQRYLRINESEKTQTVHVAKGVCFVATANIGFQYTGTRKLDAAMFDRWVKIEVDHLTKKDRKDILLRIFPDLTNHVIETISAIADKIRENYDSDDPKFTTTFSTRMCITLAELIYDGFSFLSAVERTVYPEYSTEGGNESERTYVKQIVQGLYDEEKTKYPFKSQKVYKEKVDNTSSLDKSIKENETKSDENFDEQAFDKFIIPMKSTDD